MNREELKLLCLGLLDRRAMPHPAGHQGKLAARYLLRCRNGDRAEMMFEKGDRTPANLWIACKRVTRLIEEPGLDFRLSPASALFATKNASSGNTVYGRHSGLRPMSELGHADLVCFRINTPQDLDRIMNHLQE